MASFNKSNKLSPPLMWAFRSAAEKRDSRKAPEDRYDGDAQKVVSGRRGTGAAAISEPILRREVWRDLEHLLNTVALESSLSDLRRHSHARASILNFGLPDISHRSIDELAGSKALESEIEAVLRTFEPRLVAKSVVVKRDVSVDPLGLKVRFLVSADLSCRPVDIPLEFTAEVELDSGKFAIHRL